MTQAAAAPQLVQRLVMGVGPNGRRRSLRLSMVRAGLGRGRARRRSRGEDRYREGAAVVKVHRVLERVRLA